MKKILFLFLTLFSVALFAQDESKKAPERLIFESIILTPDMGNMAKLMDNMAAHNKKYHKAGTPYEAFVYNITTGPNAGKIVWMMGPLKWADLDSRPADAAHDDDWANNVVVHLKEASHVEYWKLDPELSKNPGGNYQMLYIRYHNFSKTEGYRAWEQIKKIAATMKNMDIVKSWSVYDNSMRQGNAGRHIAMVTGMNSWADMAEDWPFSDTFEELYSRNELTNMMREMEDATTDSWDEIWTYDAKASGKK